MAQPNAKINPAGSPVSKTIYVAGIYEVDKNSGGTVTGTKTYYPAAGAMRIGSTLYYMLKDQLGSASVLTDASGNPVTGADTRYYPFGEARFSTASMLTDKLFTGQREITGLGIYYYGARFYSPKLGKFSSADSIVPGFANPQNLNRYSYANNNPTRYNDPSGHVSCEGSNWDDGPQCLKKSNSRLSYEVANTKYQNECASGKNEACPGGTGGAVITFINGVAFPEWSLASAVLTAIFGPPKSPEESMLAASGAKYLFDVRTGQYRDLSTGQFVSPDDLPWPKGNNGFATDPADTTLPEDYIIDRYGRVTVDGRITGRYASEPGVSISERGLPSGYEDMPYAQLKVVTPLSVPAAPAAEVPEFGATGGGMQYYFENTVQWYIDNGFLEVIP